LEKWVTLPPSSLEGIEKLEQLRPLAAGMSIGVGIVESAESGVDTPEDLERAERLIQEGT
jgi:3-deoxy-manno-octulosonate cytidylyltransferase (CMP-KDO synthetase)